MLKLQAKKTSEANKKKAEIEANKEIAKNRNITNELFLPDEINYKEFHYTF